jgi:hypothetical protein
MEAIPKNRSNKIRSEVLVLLAAGWHTNARKVIITFFGTSKQTYGKYLIGRE